MTFISYAQNAEDVMLWRALRDVAQGFYVDIGAADPTEHSITRAFYDRGWSGINCEPAEHYFGRLRQARPRDINLCVAVAAESGTRRFHRIPGTGLSTLDADIAETHIQAGWTSETGRVETTTLASVLREHAPRDIHFLKIDVEGAEAEVIAGADLRAHRPWIVMVEATQPLDGEPTHAAWEPALLQAGYSFVWFDGLNRFYLAEERVAALGRHFTVQPNVFDDFERFDPKAEQRLEEAARARAAAEAAFDRREAEFARERGWLLDERKPLLTEMTWLRDLHDQLHREAEGLRRSNATHREDAAELRHGMTTLRDKLQAAETALREERAALLPVRDDLLAARREIGTLSTHVAQLDRLARELRWEGGPRALQPFLPLARVARRLAGSAPPAEQMAEGMVVLAAAPAIAPSAPRLRLAWPGRDAGQTRIEQQQDPAAENDTGKRAGRDRLWPIPRRAVHQFHSGSSVGDAITNAMRLTRDLLRALGYQSEIYVEHRDPRLADELLLLDDIPTHDEYVLIVRHSMGFDAFERVAALAASKVLIYHNITPPALLAAQPDWARYAELGREQLAGWRPLVAAALADSEYNALELRRIGYETALACPLLFDIDDLRARQTEAPERAADAPYTVLFVGRVTPSKGQVGLVDAFAAFHDKFGAPCRLVLVGRSDGNEDYVREIERRAFGHGVEGDVLLTGQVSDEALHGWFTQADLYVSLSRHEGFGVPLVEAMASGVPVVALATGAVPFTLGGAGVLVRDDDPHAVAEAMLAIATDPARRDEILRRQERRLPEFRLSRQVPVLAQALAMAGAAPPPTAPTREALLANLHVTVAGHVNRTYSLAAVNRSLATALELALPGRARMLPVEGKPTLALAEIPTAERDMVRRLARRAAPQTAPHVIISQHYPVYVPEEPADARLAYFYWEESLVPRATIATLNEAFQGVLAPSQAVANALIGSGLRIPVRVVGYAPPLDEFAAIGAAREPARPTEAAPLTFLHVSSCFPRKGVDVLLAAWAEAFRASDNVRLVIKGFANPHNQVADQLRERRTEHPDLAPIELIDDDLDHAALLELYARGHVMVLPTRGEGFNIPAAEAMAAGLALIVTAGGGHRDFVTADEARLIAWRHAPARTHLASNGSVWLEPDAADLAAALREALVDAEAGGGRTAARAERARSVVRQRLDPARWAERVAEACVDLLLLPPARAPRIGWVTSWDVKCGVAEYTRQLAEPMLDPGAHVVFADRRTPPSAGTREGPRVVPSWELGNATGLAASIASEDPQVLIVQHHPGLIPWPGLADLLTDRRIAARVSVVTLHNTKHLLQLDEADRAAAIAALHRADRVCVHTVADLALLQREGLVDNVVLMPQGTPAAAEPAPEPRVLPPGSAPLIGCYGFLVPPKGIPRLLRAAALLRQDWPGLRLRLVNALYPAEESVAELATCRALAAKLGLAQAVEWVTDFLPSAESLERLGECDLIVLPYEQTPEASSAALRTALASLVPVLVTPMAIFDEAGPAVVRAEGDTSEAIAASARRLMRDVQARVELQREASAWLDAYAWPTTAKRMEGMAASLFASRRTRPAVPADQAEAEAEAAGQVPPAPARARHAAPVPALAANAPPPVPFTVPAAPWDVPYTGVASEADVFYCFRLLLGRHPHHEEWPGHSSAAGEKLSGIVASYLSSWEFAERGLIGQSADEPEVVETALDEFRLYSDANDVAVGRHARAGNYEAEVVAVFRRLLRPGMGVLDIGANIGYLTMLAASLVGPGGHVTAVEPNPRNARLLEASRRANGFDHVTLLQLAAGRETGLLTLNTSHSNGTTSALSSSVRAMLASQTIPCARLDELIASNRRINLIKIDVEGAEYNALLGCRQTIARFRPTIISEFSPSLMPAFSGINGERYLDWLIEQGYQLSVIRPDGSLTEPEEHGGAVMREYRARATDHVDIVATPL